VFDRSPDPRVARTYASAMQAARDASLDEARRNLQRTLEIAPSFAPAHLAFVLATRAIDDSTREHYRQASEQRVTLDDRERVLLTALEPLIRSRPDAAEGVRSLRAALVQAPDDGDLRYQLARAQWFAGDLAGAVETVEDVLRRDPGLPLAYYELGFDLEWSGEKDRSIEAYRACVKAAPSAAQCLMALGAVLAQEGMCSEAEAVDRQAIAAAQTSYRAYELLAVALHGEGAPLEAVRGVADQGIAKLPPPAQTVYRPIWAARLAALGGDFDAVAAAVTDWEEAQSTSSDVGAHFGPVEIGAYALAEAGKLEEARELLRGFLRRAPAWSAGTFVDPTFEANALLYRFGALSASELAERREAWLASTGSTGQLAAWVQGRQIWWFAYAEPALTADDAREALEARARFPPLVDAPSRDPLLDVAVGAVLQRAGRTTDALPYLRRGAAACTGALQPFIYIHGLLELGQALESVGDSAGACAAYARVLEAWPHPRPRSASTDAAIARRRRLMCPQDHLAVPP
jgi:predicted Zn-dependent protease